MTESRQTKTGKPGLNGPEIVFDLSGSKGVSPEAAEILCQRAIEATAHNLSELDFGGWEIGITITDDGAISALNWNHRGKDRPTNVLAFPLNRPTAGAAAGGLLGDIVLSDKTIRREAAAENKAVAEHLSHLVIHGMLHLLGYDHETATEAEQMEALEIEILTGLGIANPYADTHMLDDG